MGWKLYLDDIRNPESHEFIVCRSVEEAINEIILRQEFPEYISFDHDLGGNIPTGYDLAKWLVEQVMDKKFSFPSNFEYHVHSANPVGKKNIEGYLDGFFAATFR